MAPLHYTGVHDSAYLAQLRGGVPTDVPIAWTGPYVVNDHIQVEHARSWTEMMHGRTPLLWDNTPTNDAVMADRLFLGPLSGRDPDLPAHLCGYLANPMLQARASVPPLVSAAAWLRGDSPLAAWEGAIGAAEVLAEAVDPRRLPALCDRAVLDDAAALEELGAFFADAVRCDHAGLGEQVQPWVAQVHTEASVAQLALQVLTEEPLVARQAALVLLYAWPAVRRSEVTVFGGRGSTRPMLAQDRDSEWVPAAGCIVEPANVVDRLVQAAFERLPTGAP